VIWIEMLDLADDGFSWHGHDDVGNGMLQ